MNGFMNWIKCDDRFPPNRVYVLVARFDCRKNVNMYFIEIACRHNKVWEITRSKIWNGHALDESSRRPPKKRLK